MHPCGSQSSCCFEPSASKGRVALGEGISSHPHAGALEPQVPVVGTGLQVPTPVLGTPCFLGGLLSW